MKTSDITGNGTEWLRGSGSEADIVLSSRIRLARNVADFPFVVRMEAEQQAELADFLEQGILVIVENVQVSLSGGIQKLL